MERGHDHGSFGRHLSPSIFLIPVLTGAGGLAGSDVHRLDQVKPDALNTVSEAKHARRAVAQVHNPVGDIGTAIIDPYDDPLAVSQVGDLYEGPQREPPVGCRELKHVKILA